MALVKDTDSYVTVAEADAFVANIYGVSEWSNKTNTEKEQLLKTATQNIDNEKYLYAKLISTQFLRFPLDYMTVVPSEVTNATIYEAVWHCYNAVDWSTVGIKSPVAKNLLNKYIRKSFSIV